MDSQGKWWGYALKDGTIRVKRYFDERDVYYKGMEPGVLKAVGPFLATSLTEAEAHVRREAGSA